MNEIVGSARAVRLVWVDPPFQPVKAVSETPPAEVSNSKTDRRLSTNKVLHKSENVRLPSIAAAVFRRQRGGSLVASRVS